MSYPGNSSLSQDTQQRLLQTYEQTLDLAAKGSRQEALLGCDFILRMDPAFEPARVLFERLGAGAGPVTVDDLRLGELLVAAPSNATVAIPALRPAPADDLSFADLEASEDLALAALGPLEPMPTNGGDLLTALEAALDAGRYQDAVTLANSDPAAVSKDESLRRLAAKAQEHAESDPYVRRFLDQAREAIQGGRDGEVDKLLAKARSLNPEHPGIGETEEMRRNYAGAATLGGRRQGIDLEGEAEGSLAPLGEPGDEDLGELTLEDEEGLPGGLQLLDEEPPALAGSSAAMASGAGESDRRIAELLDEGQQAYDRGEHQAAIDAWSRIFLIDIDHSEAARRIEQARKLKAESERQVEEIFHEGAAHLDAGELEPAKAAFKKVLELQPGHLAAREMLQRAEAPPSAARRPSMAPAEATSAPSVAPAAPARLAAPRERAAAPSARTSSPALQRAAPKRTFLYVGGAVLVLALAGGVFLWLNWDRFFPNRGAALPPQQAAAAADPIARATKLHEEGKTAVAVAQLRRLPPEDPQYDSAQALIQQWEGATATATPALSGAEAAHRAKLVEDARRAYQERRYLRAELMFEQAAAISPLDATAAELLADSKRQLAPYADQIALFKQGDWEFVLPTLWRLRESNAGNQDIERLIVDAYYNLAVRDLQREDPRGAAEKLKEAVQLAPQDAEVRRLATFANTYRERQQDLLYRVFVKYLAFR